MRFSTATGELEGLNETTVTLHKSKIGDGFFLFFNFGRGTEMYCKHSGVVDSIYMYWSIKYTLLLKDRLKMS